MAIPIYGRLVAVQSRLIASPPARNVAPVAAISGPVAGTVAATNAIVNVTGALPIRESAIRTAPFGPLPAKQPAFQSPRR